MLLIHLKLNEHHHTSFFRYLRWHDRKVTPQDMFHLLFTDYKREKEKKNYQFMSGVSEWENIANQNEVRGIINQIKIITSYLRRNS